MTVLGIASLVILLLEFATRVIELFLVIRSALDLLALAELLLKLMSRIIEFALVIEDALQSHKGKERSK